MLLRLGSVVAAGPLSEVLDDARLSATFDVKVRLHRVGGRFFAQADI
jgi:ABC-type cobalamin transport system ATPase subunit